jgi:hypothetical protein
MEELPMSKPSVYMDVKVKVKVEIEIKIEIETKIEQLTISHSHFHLHGDSTCHPEPRVFQRGEGSDRSFPLGEACSERARTGSASSGNSFSRVARRRQILQSLALRARFFRMTSLALQKIMNC